MDLSKPPAVDLKELERLEAYNRRLQNRINLCSRFLDALRKKETLETELKLLEDQVHMTQQQQPSASKPPLAPPSYESVSQQATNTLPLKHEDEIQSPNTPEDVMYKQMRLQWEEADKADAAEEKIATRIVMGGTPDWKEKWRAQWGSQN
jgi:hypothetical protein